MTQLRLTSQLLYICCKINSSRNNVRYRHYDSSHHVANIDDINVIHQQTGCNDTNRFVCIAITWVFYMYVLLIYDFVQLTLPAVYCICCICLLCIMLAEPSIITSAVSGTTTETSITPSETEKSTSFADIGTTQPTFRTAPSTTTGIFFFQAEDGIRDFCLSRGLGAVYKRQMFFILNCHQFAHN